MASLGSKVLQIRSVEFAGNYRMPTRVLSSLTDPMMPLEEEARSGTLISFEEETHMEQAAITGIAFNRDEAKITVLRRAGQARHRLPDPGPDRRCQYRSRHDHAEPVGGRQDRLHLHRPAQRIQPRDGSARTAASRRTSAPATSSATPRCPRCRWSAWACAAMSASLRRCSARCRKRASTSDDLDLGNQDLGADRREIHGTCRARPAQGFRTGKSLNFQPWLVPLTKRPCQKLRCGHFVGRTCKTVDAWRRGRVVEGTSLLRKHTGLNLYRGFESLRLRQNWYDKQPLTSGFFLP